MATFYVSDFWGDDDNNGTSLATAKKTLAAAVSSLVSPNDAIIVYPGKYSETMLGTGNRYYDLTGVGKVIFDGKNLIQYGMSISFETARTIQNIHYRNYRRGISHGTRNVIFTITNCIFENCWTGIYIGDNDFNKTISYCTFINCNTGIFLLGDGAGGAIDHCTFYNCDTGIQAASNAGATLLFTNNVFDQNNTAIEIEASGGMTTMDYNVYNPALSGVIVTENSVEYSTLAVWQSASELDTNSQEIDPLLANPSWGICSVLPDSPAETAGDDGGYAGAHFTEVGYYNDETIQNGISLTDTEIVYNNVIGSGIAIQGVNQSGVVELGILDFGRSYNLGSVFDIFLERFNYLMVDSDPTDNFNTNGELTIEYRVGESLAAVSGTSYSKYSLRTPLASGDIEGSYMQFRLVLNK